MFELFVVVLLSILLITFICLMYLFLYKRKYTREKFAFSLLIHYSSIVLLFVQYLFTPDYFAAILNYVLSDMLHREPILFEKPGKVEIFAVAIIVIAYFRMTLKIYKEWNGGKSVEESENRIGNRETFLRQSIQFITTPEARILSKETKHEQESINYEQMEVERVVWHIQAAELLKLRDSQFKIDIDKHWYSQESCYISKYGSSGQIVAIFCSNHVVADAKLISFLKFVKGQTKGFDGMRYIWAIQDNVDFVSKQIEDITLEVLSECKLLETLVDFDDYKREVIRRFAENEIYEGYGLTINDIYVEPQCLVYDAETRTSEEINSIEGYIDKWVDDNSQHKQLALLGEYGQGKSVLSLRIAYMILSGTIKSKRIPIIIELRGRYIKQYHDTKEILYSWANRYNIAPKALMKLHYAGRLLLIFEGFDELDLIGGEEIRKDHFRKLWEYSIPKSKIIITGRPNYFMDDKEMITLLRLSQQRADSSKYCEIIRLKHFQRDQIVAAMRSLKHNVRDEIISVYDKETKGSSFCDLVSRPSLLFLTGLIWEKEQLASKLSNINSAEVIRAFLTYSYKRQDEKDSNAILNSDERAYFMQGIAVAIVSRHGYTNQIERKELETIVEKLFQAFPDDITLNSGNASKKLLKNRLDENHILQAINTDIRSCGILVKDFSTEDAFCFAHKSFLEVLIAEFAADGFVMKNKTSGFDLSYKKIMTIVNTLKINYNDDAFLNNENIFRFVVELLSAKVDVKGEVNSKERLQSIYKDIHLYPFPLRILGWGLAILGPSFTNKTIRYYFLASILVVPCYAFSLTGICFKGVLIALFMAISLLFYFMLGTKYIFGRIVKGKHSPKEKTKIIRPYGHFKIWLLRFMFLLMQLASPLYKTRDLKVIAFYLVCRNLNAEQALKNIWPSHVVSIVELIANRFVERNQAENYNAISQN